MSIEIVIETWEMSEELLAKSLEVDEGITKLVVDVEFLLYGRNRQATFGEPEEREELEITKVTCLGYFVEDEVTESEEVYCNWKGEDIGKVVLENMEKLEAECWKEVVEVRRFGNL